VAEETLADPRAWETEAVRLWRYRQARDLGLTVVEAQLFAESDADLSLLRNLRAEGCPPRRAFEIVT